MTSSSGILGRAFGGGVGGTALVEPLVVALADAASAGTAELEADALEEEAPA
jgi:hypothetical protein